MAFRRRQIERVLAITLAVIPGACGDMIHTMQDATQLGAQIQADVGTPVQVQVQFIKDGPTGLIVVASDAAASKLDEAGIADFESSIAMSAYRHYPRRWSVSTIAVALMTVQRFGPVTFTHPSRPRSWSVSDLDGQAAQIHQRIAGTDAYTHRLITGSDTGSHLPTRLFSGGLGGHITPTRP